MSELDKLTDKEKKALLKKPGLIGKLIKKQADKQGTGHAK